MQVLFSEGMAIPENVVNRGSDLNPREEKEREIERWGSIQRLTVLGE